MSTGGVGQSGLESDCGQFVTSEQSSIVSSFSMRIGHKRAILDRVVIFHEDRAVDHGILGCMGIVFHLDTPGNLCVAIGPGEVTTRPQIRAYSPM